MGVQGVIGLYLCDLRDTYKKCDLGAGYER